MLSGQKTLSGQKPLSGQKTLSRLKTQSSLHVIPLRKLHSTMSLKHYKAQHM